VRAFGADAGLSKEDVTERVMTVVKGFNKVEASKVSLARWARSAHETPPQWPRTRRCFGPRDARYARIVQRIGADCLREDGSSALNWKP
jgi:hypothetical protein